MKSRQIAIGGLLVALALGAAACSSSGASPSNNSPATTVQPNSGPSGTSTPTTTAHSNGWS